MRKPKSHFRRSPPFPTTLPGGRARSPALPLFIFNPLRREESGEGEGEVC